MRFLVKLFLFCSIELGFSRLFFWRSVVQCARRRLCAALKVWSDRKSQFQFRWTVFLDGFFDEPKLSNCVATSPVITSECVNWLKCTFKTETIFGFFSRFFFVFCEAEKAAAAYRKSFTRLIVHFCIVRDKGLKFIHIFVKMMKCFSIDDCTNISSMGFLTMMTSTTMTATRKFNLIRLNWCKVDDLFSSIVCELHIYSTDKKCGGDDNANDDET